jgi:hypothetical protein
LVFFAFIGNHEGHIFVDSKEYDKIIINHYFVINLQDTYKVGIAGFARRKYECRSAGH